MGILTIKDWSAWAPGVTNREKWDDWAAGRLEIQQATDKPSLNHLPPIARRRLSQLSQMVLRVGHELYERNGTCRTVLCSRFGEINQQNKITGNLIETGEVRPASFSLSVFNTPVSLLSIHEDNREATTVLLSGDSTLSSGLMSLFADTWLNPERYYMIIFADELLPEDYQGLSVTDSHPYAFALVVGGRELNLSFSVELDFETPVGDEEPSTPLDFLRWILTGQNDSFEVIGSGCRIVLHRIGET